MVKGFCIHISRYITSFLRLCPRCKKYEIYYTYQTCEKCKQIYCYTCSKKNLNIYGNEYETISVICNECLK